MQRNCTAMVMEKVPMSLVPEMIRHFTQITHTL